MLRSKAPKRTQHLVLIDTKCNINELHATFNLWLIMQRIPNQLKENKTILVPEGNSDQSQVKNWGDSLK